MVYREVDPVLGATKSAAWTVKPLGAARPLGRLKGMM
jgi:hypothetical protein